MNKLRSGGKRLRIRVEPAAYIAAVYILISGELYRIFIILTAVIIHELGHIAAARILRIKITGIRLSLTGAKIETGGVFSYKKEILLCLAGPLFNVLAYITAMPLRSVEIISSGVRDFCGISLVLAIFNLLPIRGFDGGRILYSTVALLSNVNAADTAITLTGSTIIAALWITSIYMIIRYESALSLFAFAILMFFTVIFRSKDQS
ncbi:MAG: hypothetical protein IKA82_04300 [Clostridia bacterium]|nr:hypothetical protein [Clostridia bacterium]